MGKAFNKFNKMSEKVNYPFGLGNLAPEKFSSFTPARVKEIKKFIEDIYRAADDVLSEGDILPHHAVAAINTLESLQKFTSLSEIKKDWESIAPSDVMWGLERIAVGKGSDLAVSFSQSGEIQANWPEMPEAPQNGRTRRILALPNKRARYSGQLMDAARDGLAFPSPSEVPPHIIAQQVDMNDAFKENNPHIMALYENYLKEGNDPQHKAYLLVRIVSEISMAYDVRARFPIVGNDQNVMFQLLSIAEFEAEQSENRFYFDDFGLRPEKIRELRENIKNLDVESHYLVKDGIERTQRNVRDYFQSKRGVREDGVFSLDNWTVYDHIGSVLVENHPDVALWYQEREKARVSNNKNRYSYKLYEAISVSYEHYVHHGSQFSISNNEKLKMLELLDKVERDVKNDRTGYFDRKQLDVDQVQELKDRLRQLNGNDFDLDQDLGFE